MFVSWLAVVLGSVGHSEGHEHTEVGHTEEHSEVRGKCHNVFERCIFKIHDGPNFGNREYDLDVNGHFRHEICNHADWERYSNCAKNCPLKLVLTHPYNISLCASDNAFVPFSANATMDTHHPLNGVEHNIVYLFERYGSGSGQGRNQGMNNTIVRMEERHGCKVSDFVKECNNSIVVIERGGCNGAVKVRNAQKVGALAAILLDNVVGPDKMTAGPVLVGSASQIGIPAVSVSVHFRRTLKTVLRNHRGDVRAKLQFTCQDSDESEHHSHEDDELPAGMLCPHPLLIGKCVDDPSNEIYFKKSDKLCSLCPSKVAFVHPDRPDTSASACLYLPNFFPMTELCHRTLYDHIIRLEGGEGNVTSTVLYVSADDRPASFGCLRSDYKKMYAGRILMIPHPVSCLTVDIAILASAANVTALIVIASKGHSGRPIRFPEGPSLLVTLPVYSVTYEEGIAIFQQMRDPVPHRTNDTRTPGPSIVELNITVQSPHLEGPDEFLPLVAEGPEERKTGVSTPDEFTTVDVAIMIVCTVISFVTILLILRRVVQPAGQHSALTSTANELRPIHHADVDEPIEHKRTDLLMSGDDNSAQMPRVASLHSFQSCSPLPDNPLLSPGRRLAPPFSCPHSPVTPGKVKVKIPHPVEINIENSQDIAASLGCAHASAPQEGAKESVAVSEPIKPPTSPLRCSERSLTSSMVCEVLPFCSQASMSFADNSNYSLLHSKEQVDGSIVKPKTDPGKPAVKTEHLTMSPLVCHFSRQECPGLGGWHNMDVSVDNHSFPDSVSETVEATEKRKSVPLRVASTALSLTLLLGLGSFAFFLPYWQGLAVIHDIRNKIDQEKETQTQLTNIKSIEMRNAWSKIFTDNVMNSVSDVFSEGLQLSSTFAIIYEDSKQWVDFHERNDLFRSIVFRTALSGWRVKVLTVDGYYADANAMSDPYHKNISLPNGGWSANIVSQDSAHRVLYEPDFGPQHQLAGTMMDAVDFTCSRVGRNMVLRKMPPTYLPLQAECRGVPVALITPVLHKGRCIGLVEAQFLVEDIARLASIALTTSLDIAYEPLIVVFTEKMDALPGEARFHVVALTNYALAVRLGDRYANTGWLVAMRHLYTEDTVPVPEVAALFSHLSSDGNRRQSMRTHTTNDTTTFDLHAVPMDICTEPIGDGAQYIDALFNGTANTCAPTWRLVDQSGCHVNVTVACEDGGGCPAFFDPHSEEYVFDGHSIVHVDITLTLRYHRAPEVRKPEFTSIIDTNTLPGERPDNTNRALMWVLKDVFSEDALYNDTLFETALCKLRESSAARCGNTTTPHAPHTPPPPQPSAPLSITMPPHSVFDGVEPPPPTPPPPKDPPPAPIPLPSSTWKWVEMHNAPYSYIRFVAVGETFFDAVRAYRGIVQRERGALFSPPAVATAKIALLDTLKGALCYAMQERSTMAAAGAVAPLYCMATPPVVQTYFSVFVRFLPAPGADVSLLFAESEHNPEVRFFSDGQLLIGARKYGCATSAIEAATNDVAGYQSLTAVVRNDTCIVFHNGVEASKAPMNVAYRNVHHLSGIRIGEGFVGRMKNFKIYKTALSAHQVRKLHETNSHETRMKEEQRSFEVAELPLPGFDRHLSVGGVDDFPILRDEGNVVWRAATIITESSFAMFTDINTNADKTIMQEQEAALAGFRIRMIVCGHIVVTLILVSVLLFISFNELITRPFTELACLMYDAAQLRITKIPRRNACITEVQVIHEAMGVMLENLMVYRAFIPHSVLLTGEETDTTGTAPEADVTNTSIDDNVDSSAHYSTEPPDTPQTMTSGRRKRPIVDPQEVFSDGSDSTNESIDEDGEPEGDGLRLPSFSHKQTEPKPISSADGSHSSSSLTPAMDPFGDPEVRKLNRAGRDATRLTGTCIPLKVRCITVFMSNIRNWHEESMHYGNDRVLQWHSRVIDVYVKKLIELKGVPEVFVGDHFSCTFNGAKVNSFHRSAGCTAAISLRRYIYKEFHMKTSSAVSTGNARVGNMGSKSMRRYTIISPIMGWCADLERLSRTETARPYVDAKCYDDIRADFVVKVVALVSYPKLGHRPVRIAELVEAKRKVVASEEWMYMMTKERASDPFEAWEAFVSAVFSGKWETASSLKAEAEAAEGPTSVYLKLEDCVAEKKYTPGHLQLTCV